MDFMKFVREDKFLTQIIHFSLFILPVLYIAYSFLEIWDVIYKVLIFNVIAVLMESLIGPGPHRSQPLQLARPLQDLCLCFYQARMRGSFNSYPDFCLLTLNLVFLSCILITFFPPPSHSPRSFPPSYPPDTMFFIFLKQQPQNPTKLYM